MNKDNKIDENLLGSINESGMSSFHIIPAEINQAENCPPKKNEHEFNEDQLIYSASQTFQIDRKQSFSNVISISEQGSTNSAANLLQGNRKGWILMLIGSICFSVGALLVKKVEIDKISVLELMFYRSFFAMFFLFLFDKLKRKTKNLNKQTPQAEEEKKEQEDNDNLMFTQGEHKHMEQFIQSSYNIKVVSQEDSDAITFVPANERKFVQIYALLNSIIVFAYFYGIQQLPLFEAVSLQNCSQLFTGALSCYVLAKNNRKISKNQLASGAFLLIGIYLIAKDASVLPTAACLFLGSFMQAGIQLIVQIYQANSHLMTLLFYSSFVQLIVSPIIVFSFRTFHPLSLENGTFIVFMAFLQILGTKCLQKSYLAFSHGPFFNLNAQLSILFTIFLGSIFISDSINWRPLLGALLIIFSTGLQYLKSNG